MAAALKVIPIIQRWPMLTPKTLTREIHKVIRDLLKNYLESKT